MVAWALSMAVYSALIHAWFAAKGKATSGFVQGTVEGFLGLGILLAIPSFLFALVIGWPTMSWLAHLRPALLIPLVAATVLGAVMWVLATLMLPDGWRGAAHALVGYAAVLGIVWGCLNLATVPAR
jgi:fructose-specific phosphotransferase system IIC component